MRPDVSRLIAECLAQEEAGQVDQALRAAQQALDLARRRKDREGICAGLAHSAWIRYRLGHYADAMDLSRQALEYAGENQETARACSVLAICSAQAGELDAAETLFGRARDLSRRVGYPRGLAMALHNLATQIYWPQGRFALALETMREAEPFATESGFPGWGSAMLSAFIHQTTGDRAHARQSLEALREMATPGSRVHACYLICAARLALDEDDLPHAQDQLRQARVIVEKIGAPEMDVWARTALSRLCRLQDDAPSAKAWASQAVETADQANHRVWQGEALVERAQVHWATGELDDAEADLHQAIEILTPRRAAYFISLALFLLAALYYQEQRPQAEATFQDAARRIISGGYEFLLERERARAFPLLAHYARSSHVEARQLAENLLEHLVRVPPLPLHITGLGRFDVRQGTRRIESRAWDRRKAGELFRFLLLAPGRTATRDVVVEAFWNDRDGDSALLLYRQATSALRRILEPDLPERFPSRYVLVQSDAVGLYLPPGSSVDWEQFAQAMTRALAAPDIPALEQALALYTGELFPVDRYHDWTAARREYLAELERHGLLELAQQSLSVHLPRPALDACRRILEQEPWHEEAVWLAMRAYVLLHDRPAALRLYDELERTLQQELNIAPRSDLTAFAQSLRRG